MGATQPGPRDHLVTRRLEHELRDLEADLLDEGPLDRAEAPERLARHVMDELMRDLAAGEVASDDQASRVNALLRGAVRDGVDAEVLVPARLLRGIKGRSPLGDVVPLPPLPDSADLPVDLILSTPSSDPTSHRTR